MTILPPPLRIPATLPPRRALRLRRPSLDDLRQPPVRTSSHWGPIALFAYLVIAFACIMAMSGCEFEVPERTVGVVADYALLTTLPTPGPRPDAFECTLGNLTVWGDSPRVTSFQVEGKEPVHVRSEDDLTDVRMGDVLVVVVGDLLVVGETWIRLGDCNG